jgi:predicted  nucleic acid-binding Zn-ribbon protein
LAAARRLAEGQAGFGLLSSVPSSPRSPTSSSTGGSSLAERLAAAESREAELKEELARVKTLAKSKVNDDEAEINRLNTALDDWKSRYATFVMEAEERSKLAPGASLTAANHAAIAAAVTSLTGISRSGGASTNVSSRELRDAKDEAARLLAEHSTLMKELVIIKRQRDDLSRDSDELSRKCALQTEQLLSLREQIARDAASATSVAASSTPSDVAIIRAREEAKQWESAFESLKSEHARLKDMYDKLSLQYSTLDKTHTTLKSEHTSIMDGRTDIDRERTLATADAARADGEAKRLRQAVDALQSRSEGGQRDVEVLSKELDEQKQKVSAHERRLAKQEVERARLQTMADQAQSDLNKAMILTEQAYVTFITPCTLCILISM